MHEREDQRELLLVPVRVLAVLPSEVKIEPLRECGDRRILHIAAQPCDVRDDLRSAPSAELRKLTWAVAHLALHGDGVVVTVEPEDARATTRRVDEPHKQTDGRRLSGAVRAKESEDLALGDAQAQVENPAAVAVVLCEVLGFDGEVLHRERRAHRSTVFR